MLRSIIALLILIFISVNGYGQALENAVDYLRQNEKSEALKQADYLDPIITDNYTSRNIQHTYYNQTYNGVSIHKKMFSVASVDGKVVYADHNFIPLTDKEFQKYKGDFDPAIGLRLFTDYQNTTFESEYDITLEYHQNKVKLESPISTEEIFVERAYVDKEGELIPCYLVGVYLEAEQKWEELQFSVETGQLIGSTPWTIECTFENCSSTSEHHTHDVAICEDHSTESEAVANGYEVFAIPLMSPNEGTRTIENSPWNDALNASPFGWHDTNGAAGAEHTITRGNNVYAVEDADANDNPGYAPDGGASLDFNFTLDLNAPPKEYWDAAITNLFYWNNVMHDVWYQYGFDEASGNFQDNNYGNGGLGNDYVFADCQDGSDTGNANFSPLPEGSNGRMQMFLWNVAGGTSLEINSPGSIAGNYTAAVANFGPLCGSFTGDIVLADDIEACTALNNPGAIAGNIAMIDRGNCPFVDKVNNAQDAGAIAVIMCNNVAGAPINMGGTDAGIIIPSVMISQNDCNTIKTALPANSTMTLGYSFAYDSDFDNGVIAHEYGHGISTRLTGGPSNSSCLSNSEQMGEGWSDWMGLVMTIQPSDVGTQGRGVGAFLLGQNSSGSGIRQYPYSTDFGINPHTYSNISGVSIPHGVGSVWCAMLWDMTWALIDQYGFDTDIYNGSGGNNIAMDLVTEAMKLQPCSPGFVDGRDAILAADEILYGGVNKCLIWTAFADRGLGFSADQGSSTSVGDGTEAFDLPPFCENQLFLTKTGPSIATLSTTLNYTILASNFTGAVQTNVAIQDNMDNNTSFVPGSLNQGGHASGIIVYNQMVLADLGIIDVSFDATINGTTASVLDYYEDFEYDYSEWTASTGQGTGDFVFTNTNPYRGSGAYFIPNIGEDNSQYLTTNALTLPADALMSFHHDYDTESDWDGGMVEISVNGGAWVDLGDNMVLNGYNGGLGASSNNDIAGRAAFTGTSNGYLRTLIDLTDYAGQSVQLRFFFGSDNNTFSTGWYIDDVILYSGLIIENIACVSTDQHPEICDTVATFIMPDCELFDRYFADTDGDGFGDINSEYFSCTNDAGYVLDNTDCDDSDGSRYPGNAEVCGDNKDNNCDGTIDEGCPTIILCDGDSVYVYEVIDPIYRAKTYLYSDTIVTSSQSVIFNAEQEIELDAGFETILGADFHAFLDNCVYIPPPNLEEETNKK